MQRVAIIEGVRTPFVKANTSLAEATAIDLGTFVVKHLLERTHLSSSEIDQVVFGQVLPTPWATFIAREVSLRSGLSPRVAAHSISSACLTGVQALCSAHDTIALKNADIAIAGGAESLSDLPFFASRRLAKALLQAAKGRSWTKKIASFFKLKKKDWIPVPPALREPSTGLTMGESAEKMAKENGISRQDQDLFAQKSHQKAWAAKQAGVWEKEIVPVPGPSMLFPGYPPLCEDTLIRKDCTCESLASLPPTFDRKNGTITAGSSSALTDGAAAILLMSEKRALAQGYIPMGWIRSAAFCGLNPHDQLLMGPAYATPLALERAGLTMQHMDIIELHEAFAAQVLSNTQAFESSTWAQTHLGRSQPIGTIDPAKLNVNGGAIALGHPFAATGARMVMNALRELARRNGQFALVTLCAAGGLGAALILERT